MILVTRSIFNECMLRAYCYKLVNNYFHLNIVYSLFGPRRKLIMTIDKLNELRTSPEHSRS